MNQQDNAIRGGRGSGVLVINFAGRHRLGLQPLTEAQGVPVIGPQFRRVLQKAGVIRACDTVGASLGLVDRLSNTPGVSLTRRPAIAP